MTSTTEQTSDTLLEHILVKEENEMVKSDKVYSPQAYLEAVTGDCYVIRGDNDIDTIQCILDDHGFNLWDYPMSEINHIFENNLDVVLVDCMVVNEKTDEFEHVYRWFEVPEGFEDEEDFDIEDYTPSAENGDYSPSNPWDAPGMSISDFI
ncbi:MAG: hypothetical protein UH850_14620 [Paludibacteraceae bacterium]|nr:hypothetical protein [Paludibacteraceae bacterium]